MPPQPIHTLYCSIHDSFRALLDQRQRGELVNNLELTRLAMQTASIRTQFDTRRERADDSRRSLAE